MNVVSLLKIVTHEHLHTTYLYFMYFLFYFFPRQLKLQQQSQGEWGTVDVPDTRIGRETGRGAGVQPDHLRSQGAQ